MMLIENDSWAVWSLLFGEFAEVGEKVEAEDFEKLAKELQNASPFEIMDKALEKFGDDIAIAFRYSFVSIFLQYEPSFCYM